MGEAETAAATAEIPAAGAPEEKPRYVIKIKKPGQRACDQPDPKANLPAKDKVCCGHLKRWYDYPAEVEALVGRGAEIYRCEICKTLYRPDPGERVRSYTHRT